jgi:2-polyprenyl-3-methyl-5-hydroxy-6-metoxy-1,4-benzoquinol methylase
VKSKLVFQLPPLKKDITNSFAMKTECPICYNSSKKIAQKDNLELYKCNSCFHIFAIVPDEKRENYNDDYFQKTHKNWFSNPDYKLYNAICKTIKKYIRNQEIQLLDAGCGTGTFLRYIAKITPESKLYGIDLISNEAPNIKFIKGDILTEKIDIKFNVICSQMVIEHIDSPRLFIERLKDLLKPNGILILTSINDNSLMYWIARITNKLGMHILYNRIYSAHHVQYYTTHSLRVLIEMQGFEILSQKKYNYSLASVDYPESSYIVNKIYKLIVWSVFLLSKFFNAEINQMIICRKPVESERKNEKDSF